MAGKSWKIVFGSFAFLLLAFPFTAWAQVDSVLPVPPYPYPTSSPTGNPIFGQDHSYSVVFRGNGEAVVTLKVAFSNTTSSALSRLYLRIPKVEPKEILAYQIYKTENCVRYLNNYLPSPSLQYDDTSTYCEQWNSVDHFSGYLGDASYYKARTDYNGDTLTIYLPKPVRANGSGSFFVYYRAFGYAKKNIIGAYNYAFETAKVNESIRALRIGISTDSDLFLKDATGVVNYRFEESDLAPLAASAYGVALSNPKVTNFVSQIGTGTVTKQATNLASLESYSVKGVFADRQIKLYGKEIFWVLALVVLVLGGGVFIVRFVLRRWHSMKMGGDVSEEPTREVRSKVSNKVGLLRNEDNVKTGIVVAAVTFFSPLLMVIYTLAVIFLSSSRIFSYYGYGTNYLGPIVFIIVVILSIAIYGVLLFFPALYIGLRRGLHWALATFLMTVFWIALYVFVIVLVMALFGNVRQPYITPVY